MARKHQRSAVKELNHSSAIVPTRRSLSRTIIVVPCYNEAARLDAVAFTSFACERSDIQFLFVDDGSSDKTLDLLKDLACSQPKALFVHSMKRNVGKAEAVRQGLLRACEMRPDYIGFWDADLATPLDEIPAFVRVLDERPHIEMVFGARVNLLGREVRRRLLRHYLGRVFATAAAATLGMGIYDTQCGAKMFRVTKGLRQRLDAPFIGGWIFDVEVIAREIQARRGTDQLQAEQIIYELPLTQWREISDSRTKAGDCVAVCLNLLRIYWKYLRPGAAPR